MISFSIDRHTTISDILDDFSGYYSYASGQAFTAHRGKAHRRKEVACYNAPNRNVDYHPTISNPLEVSGLNRYDED